MLTLYLTLSNNQVTVRANGEDSHQFSLLDLSQSEQEWEDFYKTPRAYGEKLFNALFRDVAKNEFEALSKQSERTIVLVLESSDLDVIAWEYAYNKAKEEYVVEDCAFVRALPEKERTANGRLKNEVERVPLLFIPANPLVDLSGEPMRSLDVDGEWREMKRHIEKSNAPFDMVELRPATPEALQSVMARFQNGMIAHFSGHGAATKEGAILLFERENGASNPLEAREFVREIKDKAWIGFLSACQSAVPERTEFSNLARELAKAGVPFALGMQFNLPDPFAPNISGQFYNYLAHGHAVPEAARQARRAVKRENEFFVGMIALYAAHPDEAGKLLWRGAGAQTVSLFRPADVSDLPSPASGLIGRQHELKDIGTRLFDDKKQVVTLHGAGGIGKTALLWQSLLRFAPSFELTLAIGLDPLPSLESVLGRIERFLGLPSPCSNDTKEREALVQNALTSKRTLLGLDNFETLNYALNEKGSEEKTAKSLHTFFKSLAANGVTLCVTSREVTNLPGETIEDVQGLSNENGGRLFQENVVKQKDEIYIDKTQQVSEMIGGHPLALRLLASAFDDQVGTSLDQYIESLQSFLPRAHDKWTEEDRHESLRASFEFTMNNLVKTEEGKELGITLSRLSVFIAFFAPKYVSSVIANQWSELENERTEQEVNAKSISHTLWKRGLLERAIISWEEKIDYIYRLHPTVGLFAKERLIDIKNAQENYWKCIGKLADIAEERARKDPFIAQITLHAIPDLMAIAESESEENGLRARDKAVNILEYFGLFDDALRLLALSHDAVLKSNKDKELSDIMLRTGFIYERRGDLDRAMKLYQQSQQVKERLGDLKGKSIVLNSMASISERQHKLDEAMRLYQQSLEINKDIDDLEGKANILFGMAGVLERQHRLDKAMKLYQQSLEIGEKLDRETVKLAALHQIAGIYFQRGNLDEAARHYREILKAEGGLQNLDAESKFLINLAGVYKKRDQLDKALNLYLRAVRMLDALGNDLGKVSILRVIASIHLSLNESNKTMKLHDQEVGTEKGQSLLNDNISTLSPFTNNAISNSNLDDARMSLEQAYKIESDRGYLQDMASTLASKANIALSNGNLDEAIMLFQQSLELQGSLQSKANTLGMMAHIKLRQKNYREALSKLLAAMDLESKDIGYSPTDSAMRAVQFAIGSNGFRILWKELTEKPLPKWAE